MPVRQVVCDGMRVWYDKDCSPTLTGMREGVARSDFFVLFVTHGVLTRSFCRLECLVSCSTALHALPAGMNIVDVGDLSVSARFHTTSSSTHPVACVRRRLSNAIGRSFWCLTRRRSPASKRARSRQKMHFSAACVKRLSNPRLPTAPAAAHWNTSSARTQVGTSTGFSLTRLTSVSCIAARALSSGKIQLRRWRWRWAGGPQASVSNTNSLS